LRTAGTPRDNLLPLASSELRAVVTKGSRTAEKALYSSRDMQEAVQDGDERSGAQQRDGALQSSTESSPEGTADLHRVTLAFRVMCQVRGRLPIWGRTLLALEGHTHAIAGQTVDAFNPRPPCTIRHLGSPLLYVGPPASRFLAAPPSARPSAARRSTAPPPPVAAGPGHHQAERDGDVQDRRRPDPSGRVRPDAARGQAVRRLQVPAPHMTKLR
jgi:hypothetical protein